MGYKNIFSKLFNASDYDEQDNQSEYATYDAYESVENVELAPTRIKPMPKREDKNMAKVNIIEPRVYGEVETMASILMEKTAIIVNFRRMDKAQAARVIDYLSGIIFAVNGSVQKLNSEIFLFAPENFQIDGTIEGELSQDNAKLDFIDSL